MPYYTKRFDLKKHLSFSKSLQGGRNFTGRTTVFHRGGGSKKSFRHLLDNFRYLNLPSLYIEDRAYNPFRSNTLFTSRSVTPLTGHVYGSYISSTSTVLPGKTVYFSRDITPSVGDRIPVSSAPTGSLVHDVEIRPGSGPSIARSAGNFVKIVRNDGSSGKILVRFPSKKTAWIHKDCFVTLGSCSNELHGDRILGKAGVSRWLGKRPVVRGIAMNPVDHPHGGRTNGGKAPRTPWGRITHGVKTRSKKRPGRGVSYN